MDITKWVKQKDGNNITFKNYRYFSIFEFHYLIITKIGKILCCLFLPIFFPVENPSAACFISDCASSGRYCDGN